MQGHPGQFTEGLANIEVAQGRNLEAGHLVPHRVHLSCLGRDLSLELQVQSIADEHLWHSRRMLLHLLQPTVDPVEAPLVGDVVDEDHALGTPRIRPNDRAEPTLAGSVPQL